MSDFYLKRVLFITESTIKESKIARLVIHLYEKMKQVECYEVSLLDLRHVQLPQFETVFEIVYTTPEVFRSDAEKFIRADAYSLVTPEYNGSFTAAIQNLFDHFPR